MTPKVEIHLSKVKAIDNRKKEVSTKLWYSTIGRLATRSPLYSKAKRAAISKLEFFWTEWSRSYIVLALACLCLPWRSDDKS